MSELAAYLILTNGEGFHTLSSAQNTFGNEYLSYNKLLFFSIQSHEFQASVSSFL